MSQDSRFPHPDDPDATFGEALLVVGAIPEKGWRVTRYPSGEPAYVTAGSLETGRYQETLISHFFKIIAEKYGHRNWRPNHTRTIAQMWKNQFLLWLWEEIDNDS